MKFIIDKQTLSDLNILGKYRSNSIFSLFGGTKSIGGEKKLEEMFLNPLTSHEEINERAATFKLFEKNNIDLPFDNDAFERVEYYLSAVSYRSYSGARASVYVNKAYELVAADNRIEKLREKIFDVIEFLSQIDKFILMLSEVKDKTKTFINLVESSQSIIKRNEIAKFISSSKIDSEASLKLNDLARLDYLLRYKYKHALEELLEICYTIDLYCCVAKVSRERGFSYAKALAAKPNEVLLDAKSLGHPQLKKAVTNDVFIDSNSNVMFLTGANMAGKSTLMKSVGVALYLSHLGFPIAAAEMTFTIADGIYTSINVLDNLNMGYSHYYAEVVRVKEVAKGVTEGKNLFIIFDELFKGTNVKDAHEATTEVSRAFAQYRNCSYILSTHIIEAAHDLSKIDNINFVYLPTVMNGKIPTYTYKLEPGVTEDRHGMMIVQNERIVEIIRRGSNK